MAKKLFAIALVAALGIAFAMPAMAEVKSIKVGGDLVIRGIMRDNLDFTKKTAPGDDGNIGYGMSTVRVYVAAELSDNVSVMVRLLNERVWNGDQASAIPSGGTGTEMDLDLAYVKLGDLFVPGLTATLGRQEILLGKGFVVGNSNGGTLFATNLPTSPVSLRDLTARKSFDAVRLDYEVGVVPLTFTLFRAKITENNDQSTTGTTGEADLTGLNAKYKVADNAVIEGYLLNGHVQKAGEAMDCNAFGLRADHNVLSIPGLAYSIEAAYEFGKTGAVTTNQKDIAALAGDVDVSYTFANPYQPKIGVAWAYYSGQDPATSSTDSDNTAWNALFPDNSADRIGHLSYAINGAPSNLSVPKIYGSFKPADKHMINLAWFPDTQMNEAYNTTTRTSKKLGWEADLGYTYQYTSDVSFGLLFGYAKSDDAVKQRVGAANFDDQAMELIGTVAVNF